jgi:hypothetical protein
MSPLAAAPGAVAAIAPGAGPAAARDRVQRDRKADAGQNGERSVPHGRDEMVHELLDPRYIRKGAGR